MASALVVIGVCEIPRHHVHVQWAPITVSSVTTNIQLHRANFFTSKSLTAMSVRSQFSWISTPGFSNSRSCMSRGSLSSDVQPEQVWTCLCWEGERDWVLWTRTLYGGIKEKKSLLRSLSLSFSVNEPRDTDRTFGHLYEASFILKRNRFQMCS